MKTISLKSETGTTLVEVVVALFIVALIVMGGGMFFFHGRVNIIREAHRRAALLVTSQRIEELRGSPWDEITPPLSVEVYYIKNEGTWVHYSSPTTETTDVDNLPDAEMLTELQWDGAGGYDYLRVTVTVNWRDNINNTVSLTSLIAPY